MIASIWRYNHTNKCRHSQKPIRRVTNNREKREYLNKKGNKYMLHIRTKEHAI